MPSSGDSVVLDTNVLFSALVAPDGVYAELVAALLKDNSRKIYYTSSMAREYEEVLYRPKLLYRTSRATVDLFMALFARHAENVMAQPISWIAYPDMSDKPFVEAAIYTDSVLITSNMKDYPFVGLKTAYPEEFLKLHYPDAE